ncbi:MULTISPECIES: SulP family inorganic anion transporter [Nocardioides]|uniref:SulP family inorganic anion transporter n=1 Tax=Nocardioides taihuensis TaxID=1835606 RepID=A0ABW0BQ42_9ACTN|nr:SulP family inorganic anion transporter [Nocardioides sp.]HQR28369.1 SulP family inorganic anion transporter [Nocardioides sp.]
MDVARPTPAARSRRPTVVPAWLRGYRTTWLTRDLVAGLTLWALVVPEAMAYASIAGVPAQFGLYSVPLAVLAYSWLGSSQRLFVGPSSTIAALTATVVAPLAATATDQYVALTAVLSLLVGAVFFGLAALRLGFISRLFAEPVLDGFIIGLGVYVVVGQLPKLVGMETPEGSTLMQLWEVTTSAGSWNTAAVTVGVGSLAALLLLRRYAPKAPAALLVVVLALLLVPALGLEDKGVEIVGTIPSGFAFVSWSGVTFRDVLDLLPGAFGIVVVGFAEGLAVAKAYAAKDRTTVDANRELLAYGAASVGAGVLQGFPPAGSLSKSAAAEDSGARTPMAFVTTAGLVTLTVLFLTGLFTNLPEPVLGAIVISAVIGMITPRRIWHLHQVRVPDFWLALSAFLGVVLIEVMAGVLIGIVLSLVLLLQRMSTPHVAVLGRHPERGFVEIDANPGTTPVPRTVILRTDGPLVFASVDPVIDKLTSLTLDVEPRPARVVIDFDSTSEIDVTAADALATAVDDLRAASIDVRFAGAHAGVRQYAARLGHEQLAGLADPYPTVAAAVDDPPELDHPHPKGIAP